MNYARLSITSLFTLSLTISGCAITTRSFEGTSETFVNTTEASVELTSSTFPRGDSDSDSDSRAKNESARREMAVRYASFNYDKIRRDASQGQGEFVYALGELLLKSQEKIETFPSFLNAHYKAVFTEDLRINSESKGEHLIARLEDVLKKNP